MFQGCSGVLSLVLRPINKRGGGKNRITHLKATSHLCLFLLCHSLLVEVKPHLTMGVCVWKI
jgi:hypothetical protein